MAEGAVSSVVEKLGNLLIQEVAFLHGVPEQIEWMKIKLKEIQCFLKDADAKRRNGDERVKNWVCEIRDVAHQTEDVLDTVMLMIEKRRRRGGFLGCLSSHKVGAEIERIKNKIREIAESRAIFGIANLGESGDQECSAADDSLQARRRLLPQFDDETDHVGVEDAKKALLKQLLAGNVRRCVISIVGMGGLGKTTLASRIYNSPDVKGHFDKSAWLSVSQDYKVVELWKDIFKQATGFTNEQSESLKDILKQGTGITKKQWEWLKDILKQVTGITKEESERMGEEGVRVKLYEILNVTGYTEKVIKEEEVREKLSAFLEGIRYLIVLDDVWTCDAWNQIHTVFPNTNRGSRVIITTRNIEVAKSADPSTPPHELRFLNDEESWQLFWKKAFPKNEDGETRYPEELEDLGRQLTKKCGGLPLALVVLGGLLSRKDQTYNVWLQMAESMDWEFTEDGPKCLEVLGGLSYDALPHHYLKSCFLYIASFPEDTAIPASKLIRLWVAEGFIPERRKQTLEETARGYLDELVQRCLIQVATRSLAHGWATRIRIHDLLRDFCISEARKGEFLDVRGSHMDLSSSSTAMAAYRVALHNYTFNKHPISLPNVRTLLCYNPDKQFGFARHFSRFKSLRVFDQETYIDLMPGLIKMRISSFVIGLLGRLLRLITLEFGGSSVIHLRYMRISGSDVRLPWSIGNLCNLITLDLKVSPCSWVPDALWKIRTLRNLYFRGLSKVQPPMTFCLENLQVLIGVRAGGWIGRSLGKHTNLRKLEINYIRTSHHKKLLTSLGKFHRLMSLKLLSEESIPTEVLTVFPNQHHLHVMQLCGKLSKLPASNEFPPNLTKLSLYISGLEQDPMPTLAKLPNLVCLNLVSPYVGKSMARSAGGFPRLQHLTIYDWNLEDWRLEVGAMPNLTHLAIGPCWFLKMLPEGLQQVTTLQELKLRNVSEELKGRVREGDGEDWYKIQHVPSITIE